MVTGIQESFLLKAEPLRGKGVQAMAIHERLTKIFYLNLDFYIFGNLIARSTSSCRETIFWKSYYLRSTFWAKVCFFPINFDRQFSTAGVIFSIWFLYNL